jgi:ribosome-associated protein
MRRRHVEGEPEPPTKGELKREAQSLQQLGEQLIAAPDAVLESLVLPEKLGDAIRLARRITSRAALARQRQYVGKLMRQIDAEPIRAALAAQEDARKLAARRFHRVERWRDRVLEEGTAAIDALATELPGVDAGELRSLAERALRERAGGKSSQASRELFRALAAALLQE